MGSSTNQEKSKISRTIAKAGHPEFRGLLDEPAKKSRTVAKADYQEFRGLFDEPTKQDSTNHSESRLWGIRWVGRRIKTKRVFHEP